MKNTEIRISCCYIGTKPGVSSGKLNEGVGMDLLKHFLAVESILQRKLSRQQEVDDDDNNNNLNLMNQNQNQNQNVYSYTAEHPNSSSSSSLFRMIRNVSEAEQLTVFSLQDALHYFNLCSQFLSSSATENSSNNNNSSSSSSFINEMKKRISASTLSLDPWHFLFGIQLRIRHTSRVQVIDFVNFAATSIFSSNNNSNLLRTDFANTH